MNESVARQPAVGCKPHLQQQCDEFPRFDFACGGYSTGGLRPPLLVHDAGSLKDNDIRGAQTHIPKSGGRQPAVGVAGRALSVMCWKRTCKRVCETTGGLRPPLLVLLQRPFAGKNGDFCGAQTHIPRSVARQPAVVSTKTGLRCTSGNLLRIATVEQREPRASARRGCGGASVVGNVLETHL
jgi:hypothetical protein